MPAVYLASGFGETGPHRLCVSVWSAAVNSQLPGWTCPPRPPDVLAPVFVVHVAERPRRRSLEHAAGIGLNQPQLIAAW